MAMPTPDIREFDDSDAIRRRIYDDVRDAVIKRFPVEDKDYRLELGDVRYDGPQDFTMAQQKHALLHGRQLRTPLRGRWRLLDKASGAVLDEREDVVMHVPYWTPRNTMIIGGNEYSVINQLRLKPGAYVRRRRSGDVETHINTEPGSGAGFRLQLEPATGVFRVGIGQARIPLYQLMRAAGVDDAELSKAWGNDLVAVNAAKGNPKTLDKLYEKLAGYRFNPGLSPEQRAAAIKEYLQASVLDPDVVARTLGVVDARGIDKRVLLGATAKMLALSRGDAEADDRDSLRNSRIYGVEDLMRERIERDAGKLTRSMMFKLRRDRTLKAVPRGALNGYVDALIFGSRLALPGDETNPLSTMEQAHRVTRLGEGGVGSSEAIAEESRGVNNSTMGFLDPIATQEGMNAGVDLRVSHRTYKGRDGKLYAEFRDGAGNIKLLDADTAADSVVAFPGELASKRPQVLAMSNGKLVRVPRQQVQYEVPSTSHLFYSHINLNNMPTAVQAGRQFYSGKYWSSYMPLAQGELPYVDTLTSDGKHTFSEYYGRRTGTLKAGVEGVVTDVDDDAVTIKSEDGKRHRVELVKNFPFNRISGISYYAAVKPGDKVSATDIVANSDFTDKATGGLTMGRNLRAAVMPMRGLGYEDAFVISSTAASKLAAKRLFGYDLESRHGVEIDRNKYMSLFPQKFKAEQLERIDANGVIRPGTTVNPGDPLILGVGPKLLTPEDAKLGKLHKILRQAHVDKTVVWEHDYPGVVADAVAMPGGAKVNVVAAPAVKAGDKLAFGGLKGVVGKVIDDGAMPMDAVKRQPYEVVINPMGFLSRVAPNHLVELSVAKVAAKTGKQVRIPQDPPPEGWAKWAQNLLAQHQIPETADVFDPETGKTIKGVSDGYAYVHAFHHFADKKLSDRGEEGGYDINLQPARGGPHGSKRVSAQEYTALLAHGATAVLSDAMKIRGTLNEDYWKALRLGQPLPDPGIPFVYEKFLNTLKAGGINIRPKGTTLGLLPLGDDDVSALAQSEIKSADLVDSDFEPIPGGLFDIGKTGGVNGRKWTYIKLNEPIPNPVMEEPVRRLLGLTSTELRDVLGGRKELNGLRGGEAIAKALAAVDVDKTIEDLKLRVAKTRGANRDNAVKAIGYLAAAKKAGMHPRNWVITKVPVIPPAFRPVARLGDVALQADLNELYRDVIEVNNGLQDLRQDLPETSLWDDKLKLYDAVTSVYGLGESITPEGRSKRLKGAIRQVIGTGPKSGLFQSQVISKPVIGVGRTVIAGDPNLDMDEVGIPEDSAWELYKDFVIRRLAQRGYPALKAMELVQNRDEAARKFLLEEMEARPVLLNRAPTWHRFNLMAFNAKPIPGDVIYVSPLVTKAFNADFDGDQMNFHVPTSEKAVTQARERMMPSQNLFSLTDLRSVRHSPSMEMSLGLYQMTKPPSAKPVKTFKNIAAARRAYINGDLDINDPIKILEQ